MSRKFKRQRYSHVAIYVNWKCTHIKTQMIKQHEDKVERLLAFHEKEKK